MITVNKKPKITANANIKRQMHFLPWIKCVIRLSEAYTLNVSNACYTSPKCPQDLKTFCMRNLPILFHTRVFQTISQYYFGDHLNDFTMMRKRTEQSTVVLF